MIRSANLEATVRAFPAVRHGYSVYIYTLVLAMVPLHEVSRTQYQRAGAPLCTTSVGMTHGYGHAVCAIGYGRALLGQSPRGAVPRARGASGIAVSDLSFDGYGLFHLKT